VSAAQGGIAISTIDEATLLAYLRTRYRVLCDPPITLRIGERSAALAALLHARGADCAAFLTAWNPRGEQFTAPANADAQRALRAELAARGHAVVAGIGEDPDGHWPGEDSVLVPGLGYAEAVAVAEAFGQNALVWAGADARPQLVLLR